MLALPVLSVALCAFVGISILHTRRDAAARLDEFRQLGTSGDPTPAFKWLQRKYGSKLRPLEGCTQKFCQYEINLSNRAVSALRIVPYTELNVWLTLYKGSVQIAMLEYR